MDLICQCCWNYVSILIFRRKNIWLGILYVSTQFSMAVRIEFKWNISVSQKTDFNTELQGVIPPVILQFILIWFKNVFSFIAFMSFTTHTILSSIVTPSNFSRIIWQCIFFHIFQLKLHYRQTVYILLVQLIISLLELFYHS